MSIDFDLSIFRLVKSFAAVEISRNVGNFSPDDGAGQLPADRVRPSDAALLAADVRPGLSAAAGHTASSRVDQIPENLDDDMRASLDQGLEGPERAAVRWQHGQRSAALSLTGLARPGGLPDARTSFTPVEPADSDQGPQFAATVAQTAALPVPPLPLLTDAIPDAILYAEEDMDAVQTDTQPGTEPADAGLGKRHLLLGSTVSLFGEATAVDVLQSMVEGRRKDPQAATVVDLETGESGQDPIATTDEPAVQKAALRDLMRLSRASVASTSLVAEQAEVPDRRSGDEEPLVQPQGAATRLPAQSEMPSLPRGAMAVQAELPEALPRSPAEGRGLQDSGGEAAGKPGSADPAPVADDVAWALTDTGAGGKATVAGVKVLEILNALVTLSAGEGSADRQSLSSVILNAAMIPGWPPPRPIESPVAVKQADLLAQLHQSAEPEEAPMTPEQMLAYLVSIGANLRLLRALQELVSRVEKKNGPALLAWLAGLVSALKVIEKSLKDIVQEGMELPEWLAELAKAAERPRRRKQFHI